MFKWKFLTIFQFFIKYLLILYLFSVLEIKNFVSGDFIFNIFASKNWTLYEPKSEEIDDDEQAPFYYDTHRCGMPIHIEADFNKIERYRPPNLRRPRPRHRYSHFNKTHFRHNDHVHRKVMGGHEVEDGEMPWAVSIARIFGGVTNYICSATLISRRHVISAAHCFVKYGYMHSHIKHDSMGSCKSYKYNAIPEEEVAKYFTTYIGSKCVNISNILNTKLSRYCHSKTKQRRFNIKKAKYSQFFDSKCTFGDYALFELEEDVPAELANHICLLNLHPTTRLIDWHSDTRPVMAYGWGGDASNCIKDLRFSAQKMCYINTHENLQLLKLPGIWRDHECRSKLKSLINHKYFSRDDVFCTMEKIDGAVCGGDSGGGVIGQFEDASFGGGKRWFLLGVVSFGIPCLNTHMGYTRPGHTSIPYHGNEIIKWINGGSITSKTQKKKEDYEVYSFEEKEVKKCE